ncbi:MAG: hypothetical protein HY293_01290, partial [Planctomycetes bacterium]|nr:hypothetical protein [Planctomycetota bacterium]
MRRTIAAALILLCGAGCSTIRTFNTGDHLWLYSGTRQNLAVWTPGNRIHDCSGMIGCVTV